MKKPVIAFRLSSISGCCRITGLSSREALIGVVPRNRHRWLIASYREAAAGAPAAPLIVADIRSAIARGANQAAADLFLILREILAADASGSASIYRGRRRDRAARLRRAGVRTLPFPPLATGIDVGPSSVLPFFDSDS